MVISISAMPTRRTLGAAVLTVALASAAGCSAADSEIGSSVTTAADADASVTTAADAEAPAARRETGEVAGDRGPSSGTTTATAPPGAERPQLVASALGATVDVWESPSESPAPERTLAASDEASGMIVLLVKQQLGPTWIEVYLPTAPAGTTGWVRQDQVSVSQHGYRIVVSRSAHTLTLYEFTDARLVAPVSIGATDAPAAAAGLYVKDLVETPSPDGPYGRYAYGLSGSGNRLEQFDAGAGVVAIHGLPDGTEAGGDVATGSLGVDEEALHQMVTEIGVPLGTPVLFTD
jgi:hypothetical protein